MRQLYTVVILVLLFMGGGVVNAQTDSVWSLQQCVQYAKEHNISIQQDVLNARLARYTKLQSQLAQLPTVNVSGSYGRSYGRSIDPTSNQFVNADYDFIGLAGNANVLLFGWFQQRNTIAKNKYSLEASKADLDQLKDDVSLNVATGYLRAILALEQVHTSQNQVDLSKAQLKQTQSFYESGRVPELNVAQLESQLATDSSNLIAAIANYNSAIIDLKALLNLDFNTPLKVQAPDVDVIDRLSIVKLRPEDIYEKARNYFGSVIGSKMRVHAAEKGLAAAKGGLYPQLSLGAQIGSNWASTYKQPKSYIDTTLMTGAYINDPTGKNYVYEPYQIPIYDNVPTGTQLNNNLRQTYTLSLTVPIFNGWQAQYGVKQARYNLLTQKLNEDQAELKLKQDVYKAYNDAVNAVQKYNAAMHAADAAQRAQDFAKKRYELGLTSTVDYLVTQNNNYSAQSSMLSAKYDLIFKLKVIDYYLGKPLKL